MANLPMPPREVYDLIREGTAIVAHPLALTEDRRIDEARQRALTIYYLASGAGGVAIGVHTTQFEVHDNGMYEPLLKMTSEVVDECGRKVGRVVKVAGIVGGTRQAVEEAKLAYKLGYHAGLVSLHRLTGEPQDKIIEHVKAVAREIPVFGFYLQPAVGGLRLSYGFWRRLVEEVENLIAIKVAPFNRYATVDVARAVADAGRAGEVALYTGNDDNIIVDLLTRFSFTASNGEVREVRIVGGLLGHWAFWTKRSMEIFRLVKSIADSRHQIPPELLTLSAQVTDVNGAVFDAANNFRGVIPGINEVLRRSGLLRGRWTLNPGEDLSPGQLEEINRIYASYPHLRDDEFTSKYVDEWVKGECVGFGELRELTIDDVRLMVRGRYGH
ncbi:MAG: dihydrodipicolinate synthase family protein [Caldivirga sp.]